MTILSSVSRVDYIGTGGVSTYDFTFKVLSSNDLFITQRDTDNIETTLVLGTDYTVTLNGNGTGTITLTGGNLTSGYSLTIRRVREIKQETDIRGQGAFFPEIHEDEFDSQIMIDQQQQDEINRAIKLPETISSSVFSNTIPANILESPNKVLAINSDADAFVLGPTISEISSAQSYATLAASAAASAETAYSNFENLFTNSELNEYVSVKDYGAKGDGITDDTLAIQNALNGSSTIVFPPGTYKISTYLTINSNNYLLGINKYTSVITTSLSRAFYIANKENVAIENLKIVTTGTAYGKSIDIRNGSNFIFVKNCIVQTAKRPLGITDSSDNLTCHHIYILNNEFFSTSSDCGIRSRIGKDGLKECYLYFISNLFEIDNVSYEDVGIELWTGYSHVINNSIMAKNLKGNYSGIVFGVSENNVAFNNTIYGFLMGIEIGGSANGLHIISGNTISGCKEGIGVTTSGIEKNVIVSNNVIEFDDNLRADYTYAMYFKCENACVIGNTLIHKDTSGSPSFLDYTSINSRKYTGIYTDTAHKTLQVVANTFINLLNGVRSAATSKYNIINGNTFNNVSEPVSDQGGNPVNKFISNLVYNFNGLRINSKLYSIGNVFYRDSDFPITSGATPSNTPFSLSYITNNTLIVNKDNTFINCYSQSFAMDSNYALIGSGYAQPDVELKDGIYYTYNQSSPGDIRSKLSSLNITQDLIKVKVWSTGLVYEFKDSFLVTYLSSEPTTGAWLLGDRVINSIPVIGSPKSWVCTESGTPGTWVSEGNL